MSGSYSRINMWGFSPALDLQKEYSNLLSKFEGLKVTDDGTEKELGPFNILVLGAGDCRHILKTLAHARRYPKRKINIYVVEETLEVLARHLLLMSIALESKERLGLQEKTELFLELFGNSLIRPQTSEYLQNKSTEFIRMVTDLDYLEACSPCFNCSLLKFRERDLLEGIFKFWRNTDPKVFDICKIWETRLRGYLGVRFDARVNVFDWDLVMKLQNMASVVNTHEYKSWREQGVAFELRDDSMYEVSNRTLASGLIIKKAGEQVACRGYWGDIVNSPYISFGIESEEQRLFKVNNGQHSKTATNVSEFNVMALIHGLMTGEKYNLPDKEDRKSTAPEKAKITEIIEEEEEEEQAGKEKEQELKQEQQQEQQHTEKENMSQTNEAQGELELDEFQIHFLPSLFLSDFHRRPKYKHLFHSVYFSNGFAHFLFPEVNNIFADEAVVTVESTKFMLDFQPDVRKDFMNKVIGMAQEAGCQPTRDYDGQKDAHAMFSFERTATQQSST